MNPDVATTEVKDAPPKQQEKKFTRQERRLMDRRELEARQTLDNLTAKFLEFFTDADDPEGQVVVDKIDTLSAQWKVYCHRKGLKKEAHALVEDYCKSVYDQYLKAKKKD